MIVKLGICVARVEVGIARRYDAERFFFDAASSAGPGAENVALGVGEDLGDRLLVAPVNDVAGLPVTKCPGNGHALRRAEGEVEASDGFRTRGTTEHLSRHGIGAFLKHPSEVLCGDALARRNTAAAVKSAKTCAEKHARWRAGLAVVADEI